MIYNQFKIKYCSLIDKFIENLGAFNTTGMPAINIPRVGKYYEKSPVKMAFFGLETNGWLSFQDFMERYTISTELAYDYVTDLNKYLEMVNNQQTKYWDYIIRFITNIYKKKNQKNLNITDLPESFIWGNINSMERFETSAQAGGAQYEDWKQIKQCSRIFDTFQYVLEIGKPDILIIMNQNGDTEINFDESMELIINYYKRRRTGIKNDKNRAKL
ncbi:MAG: hypothetical protein FWG89_01485 [Treponema sp.]|nr:hypothetical protein [Treponema sp.]